MNLTAQEILNRFLARLRAHPQLSTFAGMVTPYLGLIGQPEDVVVALDALVHEYGEARGLKIEEAA